MPFRPITAKDRTLIAAAREALRRNYRPHRHTVGAALRTASGRVYEGINVDGTGRGPCAEDVALGAALVNGDRDVRAIVAVTKRGRAYAVLSPCGNCRQMLLDYAPDATVILMDGGKVVKAKARELLPGPYHGD